MNPSPSEEEIDRLSALFGIEREFYDNWGNLHKASAESILAVLKVMGVADIGEALKEKENLPWVRFIEPVAVASVNSQPSAFPVYFPLKEGQEFSITWQTEDENGKRKKYKKDGLSMADSKVIGDIGYVKVEIPDEGGREIGYYRLTVNCKTPDKRYSGSMKLIVAPDRCYVPDGRAWGVSLSLYSLRSESNWGIGDLGDLKDAITYVKKLGGGFVGINPLHAISNRMPFGSSPYTPISRMYRNFLYIDVKGAFKRLKVRMPITGLKNKIKALQDAEFVDYGDAAELKMDVLKKLFSRFDPDSSKDFLSYVNGEGEALDRYAVFMAIAEHIGKDNWRQWPDGLQDPGSKEVIAFIKTHSSEILFHKFLQWLTEGQLKEAYDAAGGMKIGIYGDLAVGSSGTGSDAWGNKGIFAFGASASAPPDAFNPNGQVWGFPPLIPEKLRENGYELFIQTIRKNLKCAGALRIDHALGLFRLYYVPDGMTPAEGVYVKYPSEDLLRIIALESARARAAIIAEDLGTVPTEVKNRLMEFGMLSYRLFYFERKWPQRDLLPPQDYPQMALAAATTHDLPTLWGFWKGQDIEVKRNLEIYFDDAAYKRDLEERELDRKLMLVALRGMLPQGYDSTEMTEHLMLAIYKYLALTPCKLVSVSLDDIAGEFNQQNMPGTVDEHPNWRRKSSLTVHQTFSGSRMKSLSEIFAL